MKRLVLTAALVAALAGGVAVAQQSGHSGHSMGGMQMKATPANPFPQAEMQMHQKMMGAVGADASETWVRKMIEHHRGGIEMSQIVLRETRDAKVREMATKSIGEQQRGIGELQDWLKTHGKRAQ